MDRNKVHVLYLSYDGLTDPLGQSQIMPYVEGLSKAGFLFTIISAEKPEAFETNKSVIENWCSSNGVQWKPIPYHKSPSIISTIYDLWKMWTLMKKVQSEKPFQIIHCRSYLTSILGFEAKRKYGSKFIFDMRGFWADERVEGNLWKLSNPAYRLVYNYFKKKERQFVSEADAIISLTENAKQEILSWQLNSKSITVIPTCVDLRLFDPEKIQLQELNKLRENLNLKIDDFVLLYLGSWGTWYLKDEMLQLFRNLQQKKSNAKFLIVSQDKVVVPADLQDSICMAKANRDEVPLFISLSDLSIVFIKPSYSKKASSATKLGEILAMHKPVIVNKGWGDVEHLNFGDQVLLIEHANDLDFDWLEKSKSNSADLEYLSLETGVKKYFEVYNSLIQ